MPTEHKSFDLRNFRFGYLTYLTLPGQPQVKKTAIRYSHQKELTGVIKEWGLMNPLDIKEDVCDVCTLDGVCPGWNDEPYLALEDWPIDYQPAPYDPILRYPVPDSLEQMALAARVVEATNPSRPVVNLPTFYGEFKDIPMMLKNWWKMWRNWQRAKAHLAKDAATMNLTWRWFLRPLISDLRKILGLTEALEALMKRLDEIEDHGWIRGWTVLAQDRSYLVLAKDKLLNSYPWQATVYGDHYANLEQFAWGTCQWHPLPGAWDNLPRSSKGNIALLRRILTGLTARGFVDAAWQLMPWSWLVDWFLGISTFLSLCANSLQLYAKNICLMETIRSDCFYHIKRSGTPVTADWVEVNNLDRYNESRLRKRRIPVPFYSPITARVPLLTGGMLSVLASLLALKGRRPIGGKN